MPLMSQKLMLFFVVLVPRLTEYLWVSVDLEPPRRSSSSVVERLSRRRINKALPTFSGVIVLLARGFDRVRKWCSQKIVGKSLTVRNTT